MVKIFDSVHSLIRKKNYSAALLELMNEQTGRLQRNFYAYPNHAWYLVGDIYLKLEKFDLAAKALRKSVFHDAEDKDALLALGYCYSENKQPQKAKNILEKGRKLFPRDVRIRYNLANAYFDLNDFKSAKKLYLPLRNSKDEFIAQASKKNIMAIENRSR